MLRSEAGELMDAGAYTGAGRPWQLVDELVTDVASPHTRNLLQQYRKESQVRLRAQRYFSLASALWLLPALGLMGYHAEHVRS